jgi:hypothetical protein
MVPISLQAPDPVGLLEGSLRLSRVGDRCVAEVDLTLPWEERRESRLRTVLDETPALVSFVAATVSLGLRVGEWFRRRSVERSVRRLAVAVAEAIAAAVSSRTSRIDSP